MFLYSSARLQISDGQHKQPSAMLATQLNHYIEDGKIKKNGIIKLNKYICNAVGGRRIVIILELEVLHEEWAEGPIGRHDVHPVVRRFLRSILLKMPSTPSF